MGWEHLIIRPETRLSPADRRRVEKAVKRAKREGKIARTAQQTIPYEEMYQDGVCRITDRLYSKSVVCEDINYAKASDDEKAVLFELYCKLVNYFGPSVGFELSVVCYPADMVEYRKMLAITLQGDSFDEIRKEYSDMLIGQVSRNRYERRICLTYTIEAEGVKQARSRLGQIDSDVVSHFHALMVTARPMDGYERLALLHKCLHLEEGRKFRFNWDSLNGTGLSSKDYIAPSSFFFGDGRYFRTGASFGAVSFLQIQATKLYDTLLNSILDLEGSQIVSIHAKALDQNAALKAVKRKLSDLDKAKIDEQKRAVRSGFDMDILPPDLVTFGREAQKLLEDLQNHDEKMFMVTILIVHMASSRQKLENLVYSADGITNTQNCDLIRLDYQQEQGFLSALPIGINQVEIQRGLTTSGTAIFLPFRACEVFQKGGVYYGLNATTGRMILADRKKLKCPNGVVLGTPGSGKSFSCKREATDVYLHTDDDLLFLDPEHEYLSLCQQLSGQIIRLAPDSGDYINPLDVDLSVDTGENPLLMKADFIMSFCELILSASQGGLKPIEKSVIDRCIPKVYREYLKKPRPERMPVLGDLYQCLRSQEEGQAQELATALELYVSGSLSYLNHQTNVNINNRVVCYDISALGQNLKKPGMLTVQNNIWQRTTINRYAGKTTRIYLDEFHLLLKEPQTAAYTAEIYKRFRKWNGIPTALTQNVKDLLDSPEIENILENSDFILMLNQAASDRNILAQRLGISPQELTHITNSGAGEGLLFFGDKIIPFIDKFPTDTKLYQVMTTKPADLTE
ncbi:conjugal transfer protein TraE [Clostridiaceae bacterium]|nr:conjugal transfer protein TraE [Clostridiaceae bacterium]